MWAEKSTYFKLFVPGEGCSQTPAQSTGHWLPKRESYHAAALKAHAQEYVEHG